MDYITKMNTITIIYALFFTDMIPHCCVNSIVFRLFLKQHKKICSDMFFKFLLFAWSSINE